MMRLIVSLAAAFTLLGFSASSFGGTIDFENAPMTFWENGGAQDLGGFYAGVTFGTDVQIVTSSALFPAHSGNLELTDANLSNPDLVMTFDTPQTDVSFWYSTSSGFAATAFDSGNNSLASFSVAANVSLANAVGVDSSGDLFTGVADIDHVVIADSGGLGGFITLDDVSAAGVTGEPAVVPEVGGGVLLGVCGVGLLFVRRRVAVR
jgi:hypothetical protein